MLTKMKLRHYAIALLRYLAHNESGVFSQTLRNAMSVITIQCRLLPDESSLRHLWKLMAEKNTPLVNELLSRLGTHPDFETWLKDKKLPQNTIKELCNFLKVQEAFVGQPCRFYASAIALVAYTYKSWFALQKRRQRQIEGKERWLNMLKSDLELEQESDSSLEMIRAKANEILAEFTANHRDKTNQNSKARKGKKTKKSKVNQSVSIKPTVLFEDYDKSEDTLTRCSIVYLLKNNCQVSLLEEEPDEYAKLRRKKEIEIERLKEQLKSRIPKGRDLTGSEWSDILKNITNSTPQTENEAKLWQASLLRKSRSVPFPVAYETSEDMYWEINEQGRIFVRFNGLGKLKFEVYCDQRQLHYFQRFVEDWETKRKNKNQYSSSLFTLRSGRLVWLEQQGKGEPWNVNRLILYCSLDTRMWSQEGTQQVINEKIVKIENNLTKVKEKGELNPKQQAFVTRQKSTLARINTPFPRPSKPLYKTAYVSWGSKKERKTAR